MAQYYKTLNSTASNIFLLEVYTIELLSIPYFWRPYNLIEWAMEQFHLIISLHSFRINTITIVFRSLNKRR